MIYFTSDTHFYHKNILQYQAASRPFLSVEEMNESIIKTWNQVISPKDEVYHLGDVSMGHKLKTIEILDRLNGRIHLIKGNHDHFPASVNRFESISDYKILRFNKDRYVLFHFPIQEWDRCYYGDIHLHGHCHGNLKNIKPNRFDIGWDVFQRPVSIEEVNSWRHEEYVPHHGKIKTRTNNG